METAYWCAQDSLGLDGYICSARTYLLTDIYCHPCPNASDCGQNATPGATCVVIPNQRHIVVDEPNDGVVPVRSQRGYNGIKGEEK